VTVRRSIPAPNGGDWTFRLTAAAGARRRAVSAVLRCVRLALPAGVSSARLVTRTRRPPSIAVPAGSSAPLEVDCARGFAATGYGLDRGAGSDLAIAAAVPSDRGWRFRVENSGGSSARGGASTQMTFGLAQRRFSNAIGAGGAGTYSHSCGRSQFSVATGSEVDAADSIEIRGSNPVGSRGGRWAFARARTGDRVKSFLVCLSRRTQFG
jgi:hypothetical protein